MLRIQDALTGLRQHGGMPASLRGWTLFRLWIAGLFIALLAACGGGGGSSSTTGAAPGAPSAVTVIGGDNETTISWGAAAGATSYNVYRSTTQGAQGTKIGSTTTTSYVDAGAANGTTYYYQVTAANAAGEGSASTQPPGVTPAVPVVAPAAPTGLNATAGDAQVTLNWTAVAGARSYNVYRSATSGSQGAKIGSSSTTQFVDTAVSNGSTYYYAVTADNAAGEGAASSSSSGVTPAVPVTAPAAPTGVNAVAGNGQVTVSWTAVAAATSYNVYRSTSAATQGSKVGSSATTRYDDATAANGTTYYYVVTASNAAGEGPASAASSGATPSVPVTVPPAPTGVNAVAGNALVTMTWTAAPSASSYKVYRSTSQGSQGSLIGSSATSSYSDAAVVNGTTYYYVVTATNSAGEGPASTQSAAATPQVPLSRPLAPTGVNATAGNAQVTLAWTAVATATSYNVYRSTTPGVQGTKIGSRATVSYTDSTTTNGTTYYYQITAVNAAGESTPSTQSSGATPAVPLTVPAAPASVNATDGAAQVTVSWTAVSTATSYKVYRSTTQGVQGTPIGSTSSTSLADSTVVNGTTYYFVVTASNAAGEGAASAAATVTHGTRWTSVKFGGGGYVTGLIFHPTSANLLYARTDIGGAYRWNQSTLSWLPITDGLGFGAAESSYHGIESIALDPNNDQLVYMAAGMYNSDKADARLYISSDRADHWTYVNLPFSTGGNNGGRGIGERLMVDPNKPSTLFYGSRTAGLWKSTDSGRTWGQVSSLSAVKMTQDQIDALGGSVVGVELVVYDTGTKGTGTATQTLYAAIAPDYVSAAGLASNLYKSTDSGATWTPVSTPVSGYYIPHMVRAADGMFYVVFTKDAGPGAGGPGRLYKFDGSNWTLLKSEDPAGGANFGLGGVSVFGSGATTRIALGVTNSWGGGQIVQLSDDGGQTWREIEVNMPGETASGWVDDLEIDPSNRDHILHVHGGGIVETRNASSATPSWSGSIEGIEETAAQALATPPAGAPYILVNSSGDVGPWVHTDLATKPTLNPGLGWSNGISADMAWSDPLYIAGAGVINSTGAAAGYWSGDGGKTWATFATLAAGAATNTSGEGSIVVTARNKAVWSPANSVPSYTTDNGASWVATNLPALASVGWNRGYRLAADRKNPNKVYAYDSGGAWWGTAGKVYVSTDAGHSFTLSQGSVAAGLSPNSWWATSMVVNPNAEGDLWLADGNAVYHSVDSGATWTKLSNFASVGGTTSQPDVQGATAVALGKAKAGASYSAAVYVVGTINGVWGVHRSDDGGATWTRFNDDAHQFGGIGVMAADQGVYGRIYITGTGRGVLYSN